MFLAIVDHLGEMLSVQMNLGDALECVAAFAPQGYLFEGELTQVSVSPSKPHPTTLHVEEG
jgi:hypothetical protein